MGMGRKKQEQPRRLISPKQKRAPFSRVYFPRRVVGP
jgi:hypothetical protein